MAADEPAWAPVWGVGNDICDIRRIEQAVAQRGPRFAQKILGPQEWRVYAQRCAQHPRRGVAYLANRFSAKESFAKAVGLGMRLPMTWRDCQILNLASGQPCVVLSGALQAWFDDQGLRAHVSVSDEGDYATSVVVVYRNRP